MAESDFVNALGRFRGDEDVIAVFDDDELAGLLSRRQVVLRALQRAQELDDGRRRRRRGVLRHVHLSGES